MSKAKAGKVFIVGLGPGPLGFLTHRAVEVIREAETIVVDGLVDTQVAALAGAGAEWVLVGANDVRPALETKEVRQLIVGRAKGGRRVVRLLPGDPVLFAGSGTGAKELEEAGVSVEIVPGISAVQAVASAAGVPLHEADGVGELALVSASSVEPADCAPLLKRGGVLAVFDPLPKLLTFIQGLTAAGVAPGTPAVAVSRAGTGAQRRVAGGLAEIAGLIDEAEFFPPALLVIGSAVKERRLLAGRERLPLSGRRLVLTRTREQAGEWRGRLEELGAEVLELPLIQVRYEAVPQDTAEIFAELGSYDWIVFTSANGVRGFFKQFFVCFKDLRALGIARLAVVGEATAAALAELHLQAELQPEKQEAAALGKALVDTGSLDSAKVLVVTGNLNRDDLVKTLEEGRAIVDRYQVYHTEHTDLSRDPGAVEFRARGADAILFTSSSAVRSFVDQSKHLTIEPDARRPLAASIGTLTSATMREFRLPVDVEATQATLDSLVDGLRKAWK